MSPASLLPAWLCRPEAAMRALVLAILGICQMPLPVGHDHGELMRGGQTEMVNRHLALFHSGNEGCHGWHVHLLPPAFWGGGTAEDGTGIPAPESDGGDGVPLVDTVCGTVFAPNLSAMKPASLLFGDGCDIRPEAAATHFLCTYGPGSELSDLLCVTRC